MGAALLLPILLRDERQAETQREEQRQQQAAGAEQACEQRREEARRAADGDGRQERAHEEVAQRVRAREQVVEERALPGWSCGERQQRSGAVEEGEADAREAGKGGTV